MDFRISLLILQKQFGWICINSIENFGRIDILTKVSILIHEHGMYLSLFSSFLTSCSNVL